MFEGFTHTKIDANGVGINLRYGEAVRRCCSCTAIRRRM